MRDRARSRSFGCPAPCGRRVPISRFPSSAAWTNVRLDVRSGSGFSCASRAALVVLVLVVEVWPLDAVRAVCGAGRIVDEGLRRPPASSRSWSSAAFVGCLVGAVLRPVAASPPLGRTAVRFTSRRGSLLSASDRGATSGWCSRWSRRSVRHGNAMRRFVLLAAVEAVRRPASGTGRVVARGLVGARRGAGWRVRLLDAGLLDVMRIPVLVVALWSFGSTAVSRGVPLDALPSAVLRWRPSSGSRGR